VGSCPQRRSDVGKSARARRSSAQSARAPPLADRRNERPDHREVKGRESYRPSRDRRTAIPEWFDRLSPSWRVSSVTLPWQRGQTGTWYRRGPRRQHWTVPDGVTADKAPWMYSPDTGVRSIDRRATVLNTSHTGKPIIHTVDDALAVFMTSDLTQYCLRADRERSWRALIFPKGRRCPHEFRVVWLA
jgi:hypothetical protein